MYLIIFQRHQYQSNKPLTALTAYNGPIVALRGWKCDQKKCWKTADVFFSSNPEDRTFPSPRKTLAFCWAPPVPAPPTPVLGHEEPEEELILQTPPCKVQKSFAGCRLSGLTLESPACIWLDSRLAEKWRCKPGHTYFKLTFCVCVC